MTEAFTARRMSSGVQSMGRSTPWNQRPNITGNFFASGKRVEYRW